MADLDGKVALVTGSSSGIGAAVAAALAERGAKVVLNSRSSADAGERLARDLPNAMYVQADVCCTHGQRRRAGAPAACATGSLKSSLRPSAKGPHDSICTPRWTISS